MILAIKQYLSTLKESKELDAILPDLLSVMEIRPIMKPLVGVRQKGVDIEAVGKDPDSHIKTLFLFVIKCGDLGRSEWDTDEQSIRQSINEIKDVYLLNNISPEYKDLPIEIILVTGGNLQQSIQEQWIGYIKQNQNSKITFSLWDGDRLAEYFYKYMFNEGMLIPEYRSIFRRALVRIDDPSYNLKDIYQLIDLLIKDIPLKNKRKNKNCLLTMKICLKIFIQWSKDIGNLKHAISVAEFTVLRFWEQINKTQLFNNKSVITILIEVYNELLNLLIQNTNKFSSFYSTKNGLHGYTKSGNSEIESLRVFEQLGFLAETGLLLYFEILRINDINSRKSFINTSSLIEDIFNNHLCLLNPLYDSHSIEINMSLYVLYLSGKKDFIVKILLSMIEHIHFAYVHMSKYFPICSDNFHDLINVNSENKDDLFQISTLLFWILKWACILENDELYDTTYKFISEKCPNTIIQQWYPSNDSDEKIYVSNAGYGTGITYVCNPIPKTMKEMIKTLKLPREKELSLKDFSCTKVFPELLFVSNRHFRTPFIPEILTSIINEKKE